MNADRPAGQRQWLTEGIASVEGPPAVQTPTSGPTEQTEPTPPEFPNAAAASEEPTVAPPKAAHAKADVGSVVGFLEDFVTLIGQKVAIFLNLAIAGVGLFAGLYVAWKLLMSG